MTTIAYRDGAMASDSLINGGGAYLTQRGVRGNRLRTVGSQGRSDDWQLYT